MPVWDLFSKREKRKRMQGQEDVFQYDTLPEPFRVQVVLIWRGVLGPWHENNMFPVTPDMYPPNGWWQSIHQVMLQEKGRFALCEEGRLNPADQCVHYLLQQPTENALDIIEVSFQHIDGVARQFDLYQRRHYGMPTGDPDDAIRELNARFREHGIGYEYTGGEIIRVDSKYIHAEAVKPAIQLLHGVGRGFDGPLQEFFSAHERYRKGERKDAISWALKAFESTLKAICTARGWTFDPHKDTASKLIEIVLANGLVPSYLQGQFTALRSVMESGVPTVRNKTSGHGQGPTPTDVPDHLTRYVLNLTASNIVFLLESHRALP